MSARRMKFELGVHRTDTKALRALSVICVVLSALAIASRADAQQQGFALNRYEPAARGSDWFVLESLDLRGHVRPAVGLTLDWGYKPLVLYDANNQEISSLVAHQLFLHVGAALTLWERLRVGANIPIALFQAGDAGGTSLPAGNRPAFGDIRLDADVRIFGVYQSPITLAAGLQFFIPSGSPNLYTGDGSVRFLPRAMLSGKIGWFEYAAKVAFNIRLLNVAFAGTPVGSEMQIAVAAGARLANDALIVGPEFYFSTGITQLAAFFNRLTTPVELLIGGHYTFLRDFRVGLAFGPGLSRGLGSPAMRGLFSFDWAPAPKSTAPKVDRDKDGFADEEDGCPDEPGIETSDRATMGCPAARLDAIIKQIRIVEQIKFETGSAKILAVSDKILSAVGKMMNDNPSIKKLRIEGHTDNRGGTAANQDLSERRAASVRTWLIEHGVVGDRLTSRGFGESKPIAPNTSERGRHSNRRVEFHIEE